MSTYYLMNKDKIVLAFEAIHDSFSEDVILNQIQQYSEYLPFGFKDMSSWIDGRKALKHNAHLKRLMEDLGCADNEGFIRLTHAVSINDTFWVKSVTEDTEWKDVSLYQNQFSEVISKLAFEGLGLNGESFSPSSPELTCDGSFKKCFLKEKVKGEFGSDIFLYKRGYDLGVGLEPYSEALSSEIARVITPHSVRYEICHLHNKLASRCNLFSNEALGYSAFYKVFDKDMSFPAIRKAISDLGYEQEFREMLVTDALTFNTDRHAGNYGFLFDNDNMSIKAFAPVFDLNLSLLSSVSIPELKDVGDALYERSPKLGDDFTRLGQIAVNDIIRDKVKDIKDFSFSFRGDDVFTEERVKALENIIRKQAEALLSKQVLYTKDVFVSNKRLQQEQLQIKLQNASKTAADFCDNIDNGDYYEDTVVSVCDNNVIIENNSGIVVFDFLNNKEYIESGYVDSNLIDDLTRIHSCLSDFLKQNQISNFSTLNLNALAEKLKNKH